MDPVVTPLLVIVAALLSERRSPASLSVAGPGIRSTLRPGEVVVYRTARSREESDRVISALERGEPGAAFSASTALNQALPNHPDMMRALGVATRRGQVPLFVTPYVSVAAGYRTEGEGAPPEERGTWALVLPADAVIWRNPRALARQGVLYSLFFCDSEYLVDARRVRRVSWVPAEVVDPIAARVEELNLEHTRRRGFRDAYVDADPELARAAMDAVTDLRVPPRQLGRLFLERPMALPGRGTVQRGQRVLLLDGQVVTLRGATANHWRPLSSGTGARERVALERWDPEQDRLRFQCSALRAWAPQWSDLDRDNLDWRWIVRGLSDGERLSRAARAQAWRDNRMVMAQLLRDLGDSYERALAGHPDPDVGRRQRDALHDLAMALPQAPPWSAPGGDSAAAPE